MSGPVFDIDDCEVVSSSHAEYESRRKIFNGYVDRRPTAIIYPETPGALLSAARRVIGSDKPFSIRAGGHNVAGTSLVDGGYVLDTSRLHQIEVDRPRAMARVQPGAFWRDFDSSCAKFGLCTPGGIISDTGVAGLTLGGGIGWLNGLYGLACDNLIEADVLLASGDVVRASSAENFDLLWALRGGGGNFGLVTSFVFKLNPLPQIYAGSIVSAADDLSSSLRRYVDCCESAPDGLTISLVATGGEEPKVSMDVCYAGDAELGAALTDPLARSNHRDTRKRFSYVNWQRQFDDDQRRGRRSYWRAVYIRDLCDPEFVRIFDTFLASCPSPHTMLTVDHVHGASHRVGTDLSSYGDRISSYLFLVNTNWEGAEFDDRNIAWSNELYAAIAPFSAGGTYVNYLSNEGERRVHSAYGAQLPRLREIKAIYDKGNRFRSNQNILPA